MNNASLLEVIDLLARELKINYVLPVTSRKVRARSHFLHIGKTLCVARVDVFDDQKNLAAVALVTYMILPQPRK